MPLEWVGYQDAVRLYHLEQVAYTCGTLLYRIHGGICASTGRRSIIDVNSIIATHGRNHALNKFRGRYSPPLNNPALFRRDSHVCLLAVPFVPTHAEYIYLQSRRVLADQMEFLRAHFPRSSPLHQRIALTT